MVFRLRIELGCQGKGTSWGGNGSHRELGNIYIF